MAASAGFSRSCWEGSAVSSVRSEPVGGGAMSLAYRIVPAGDSALIVEFDERIDPDVNARTIACADAIEAAGGRGGRARGAALRPGPALFSPPRDRGRGVAGLLQGRAPAPRRHPGGRA